MTPGERQILQGIGQSLLVDWIAYKGGSAFLYGLVTPIAIITACQHPSQTWHSKCQVAVLWFGIIASTANLSINILTSIIRSQVFQGSVTPFSQHLQDVNASTANLAVSLTWLEAIPPVINDAFIIWRAWVVFQKRRWMLRLSIILCLGYLVFTLVVLSMFSDPDVLLSAQESNSTAFDILSDTRVIFSFLINFIATSLIGWTLWKYKRFLRKNIDSQQRQSFKLWNILGFLVDAGALYAVLQLLMIVMSFAFSPNEFSEVIAFTLFQSVYYSISFVYPALTIALVRGPFSIAGIHESVQALQLSAPGV